MRSTRALYSHHSPWHICVTLLPVAGWMANLSSLHKKLQTHFQHPGPLQSHAIACNRNLVPARQAAQYLSLAIIRQSLHSLCLIKKLVSTSPANACFFAVDFLGEAWACVIVADDCEYPEGCRRAIGENSLAERGRSRQGRCCQEGRMNTVQEGAMRRCCRNAVVRRSGAICVSVNHQRRSQRLRDPSLHPAERLRRDGTTSCA